MKVGIDIRPLQSSTKNRGIGYYTANVLSEMLEQKHPDFHFVLYKTLTGKPSTNLELKKGDKFYGLPTLFRPRRGIRRFDPFLSPFWSMALKETKPDLLHLTSFFEVYCLSMPADIKTVVTLHDLIPLLFEKWCFDNELAKQWYLSRLEQIKNCSKIITISNSAKEDIVRILGVPEGKVVVVYGGLDKRFQLMESGKVRETLAEKYKITDPFILAVGAPSYHKNVSRIFSAFAKYLKTSSSHLLRLVVVCKLLPFERESWEHEIRKLDLDGKVVLTNFIPNEDLPLFYNGAEALLFPSLYEGFGLPILEAMACGTPVITSNASSMPEVGGGAAYYVNPEKTEEIVQGIGKVLNDRRLRERMIKEGLKQINKFSWEKAAKQMVEVYKSILES